MNGAGIGIIVGLIVVFALVFVWWKRDGGESDRRIAAERAAARQHQQRLRADPDYNFTARARAFGFTLDLGAGSVTIAGQGTGRFAGSVMRVETEGQLTSRITATRLVALGVFALAARKTVDDRQLYLTVDGDGFQLVSKVDPTLGAAARQFAATYNTRSGGLAKQPTPGAGTSAELERLAKLHADGALTDQEFAAAKARLLGTHVSQGGPEDQRPTGYATGPS